MRKIAHAFVFARRHLSGKLKVEEIPLVKRFISNDSICFDIGAHGGSWSRPLSRLASNGKVYSFEALPYYADVLNLLFKLLFTKNIEIINKAVSDKEGTLSIAWKDESGNRLTGKTHVLGPKEESSFTVQVPSTALDTFISERGIPSLTFMKIDVEGAEMLVYKGARKTLERFRPVVFCELDERWTARYDYKTDDVFDFFAALKYEAFVIWNGERIEKTDKSSYSKRGDVLFVPEEKEYLI